MSTKAEVLEQVHRLLTDRFGSVVVDQDGDLVLDLDPSVIWVGVQDGVGPTGTFITIDRPMTRYVPPSNELFHWVATEGQCFNIGSVQAEEDDGTVTLVFSYSIIGDDFSQAELINSVLLVSLTADMLVESLCDRFGGEVYGRK